MELTDLRAHLLAGQVIPAHPLALTAHRHLDETRQRALTRYYLSAGAGGIAVAVHTTQFAIRESKYGLLRPVLELAIETSREFQQPKVMIAGAVGSTTQAAMETHLAAELGYDAVLLSLGALKGADESTLLAHCRRVAEILPLMGFYLQPAVGGRLLSHHFWREFFEIERVVGVKIAPFNRYQTLDVVRACAEAGREDVALYTGNDDSIITDLLTPFPVLVDGAVRHRRIVGGLLGHWAVWTRTAVRLLEEIRQSSGTTEEWMMRNAAVTDANAAVFDAANRFRGCIPGIHEILRRAGLLEGTWCLDHTEMLSKGQSEELDRVTKAYPWMNDFDFVQQHLDEWLR
jgi:dihydrodipicolinate synthase/N-acetylneuraminate lyase